MAQQRLPLFLITGTPGSGKTATAKALMRRFPFGMHIPVDDLRERVVAGIAHPVPAFTEETGRQFRLARSAAAQVAAIYADAGFAVAIDDVVHEPDAQACFVAPFAPRTVHKILLRPALEVALARNATRTNKYFDTSVLTETIRGVRRSLNEQNRAEDGWIFVDNSTLDIEQTVDAVLMSASALSSGIHPALRG
jgi:predicted kinase